MEQQKTVEVESIDDTVLEFGDASELTQGGIFGFWDGGNGLQR